MEKATTLQKIPAHTCVESTLYPYRTPGKNNLGERASRVGQNGDNILAVFLLPDVSYPLWLSVFACPSPFARITLASVLLLPAGHCQERRTLHMYSNPKSIKNIAFDRYIAPSPSTAPGAIQRSTRRRAVHRANAKWRCTPPNRDVEQYGMKASYSKLKKVRILGRVMVKHHISGVRMTQLYLREWILKGSISRVQITRFYLRGKFSAPFPIDNLVIWIHQYGYINYSCGIAQWENIC